MGYRTHEQEIKGYAKPNAREKDRVRGSRGNIKQHTQAFECRERFRTQIPEPEQDADDQQEVRRRKDSDLCPILLTGRSQVGVDVEPIQNLSEI